MKLVKTKLLLKHDNNSAVGIATASHIDFCKYQFKCLRPQWSYNEYMNMVVMFIASSFALLSIPLLVLTHGLILYPFWIVNHIIQVRKIVKIKALILHQQHHLNDVIKDLEHLD